MRAGYHVTGRAYCLASKTRDTSNFAAALGRNRLSYWFVFAAGYDLGAGYPADGVGDYRGS
jgi:hypothetical protein